MNYAWSGLKRPASTGKRSLFENPQHAAPEEMVSQSRCVALNVSVARENGSAKLRMAPVCRALSSQQARQRGSERPSVQAALLELLAAAARAGIVAPHTLERVNKRQRRVGKGQTGVSRAYTKSR